MIKLSIPKKDTSATEAPGALAKAGAWALDKIKGIKDGVSSLGGAIKGLGKNTKTKMSTQSTRDVFSKQDEGMQDTLKGRNDVKNKRSGRFTTWSNYMDEEGNNEGTEDKWNEEWNRSGTNTRKQLLDNHFPEKIKSSSAILKNALMKKDAPFSSYLYKFLVNYTDNSGTTGDISMENAKTLINHQKTIGDIVFEKEHGTSGLNLSKDDFQLKAIVVSSNRGIDMKELREGGKWKTSDKMKKTLQTRDYSNDPKTKSGAKKTVEVEMKDKTKKDVPIDTEAIRKSALKELSDKFGMNTKLIEGKSTEEIIAILQWFKSGGK